MPPPLFQSDAEVAAFASALRTTHVGKRIDYRARVASTNDLALQAARDGAAHGLVFIAEAQDAGRGRRGRQWHSPPRLGLLFSVLVRPALLGLFSGNTSLAGPGWVPLVTGLACTEALAGLCGLSLAAKWPNDIVASSSAAPGWRKLGGILCESALPAGNGRPAAASDPYVIIGIGLNLNHTAADLPAQARTPPTSVLLETGKACTRLAVLRAILERLEQHLLELYAPASGAALKQRIEDQLRQWWPPQRALYIQAPGVNGSPERTITGRLVGLDDQGRLLVQDPSGRQLVLADAEILGGV